MTGGQDTALLEVFNKYIGKVFAVHLGKYNVKFPDVFFIDWHGTAVTYQLSELFSQLVIILISLSTQMPQDSSKHWKLQLPEH